MLRLTCLLVVCLTGAAWAGVPPAPCKTIWEQKCWDEPREVCNEVPFSSTVYEDECKTVYNKVCQFEDKEVVSPELVNNCKVVRVPVVNHVPKTNCHEVSEYVCTETVDTECLTKEVENCVTEPGQETCQTTQVRQCRDVTRRVCDIIDGVEKCWDEPEVECWDEPSTVCSTSEPRSICSTNLVDLPCTNQPRQSCGTVTRQQCDNTVNEVVTYEDKKECTKTRQDRVARIPHEVCENVAEQECRPVPKTRTATETVCSQGTERVCKEVSRKSCGGYH